VVYLKVLSRHSPGNAEWNFEIASARPKFKLGISLIQLFIVPAIATRLLLVTYLFVCWAYSSSLKSFFETSVNFYQISRPYVPVDSAVTVAMSGIPGNRGLADIVIFKISERYT
jgi:hypothetical protein